MIDVVSSVTLQAIVIFIVLTDEQRITFVDP